jgi:arylsulfatase A-like enzyme
MPQYQRIGDETRAAFYRAGYNAEVRYTDEEIGRLLQGVRARGMLSNTVIVFAADHGEALGENDYWFAHGEYLIDPLVRVPFFIRDPDSSPSRRRDLAALVDVLPTVLPLFGAPTPFHLPGRNLLEIGASNETSMPYLATLRASTVPRYGLVRDGFKYVATFRPEGLEEELFRLGEENQSLATEEPERLEELRRKIGAFRGRWIAPMRERRRKLTEKELEKLRALGYVASP